MISCDDCRQPLETSGLLPGVGYAQIDAKRVCYACCGVRDSTAMVATGKATLYLTQDSGELHNGRVVSMGVDGHKAKPGKVTNWPGTLTFVVLPGGIKRSRHNIAGTRYDVWFAGPDGATWHGVTYGDNTQICHCKRTKG